MPALASRPLAGAVALLLLLGAAHAQNAAAPKPTEKFGPLPPPGLPSLGGLVKGLSTAPGARCTGAWAPPQQTSPRPAEQLLRPGRNATYSAAPQGPTSRPLRALGWARSPLSTAAFLDPPPPSLRPQPSPARSPTPRQRAQASSPTAACSPPMLPSSARRCRRTAPCRAASSPSRSTSSRCGRGLCTWSGGAGVFPPPSAAAASAWVWLPLRGTQLAARPQSAPPPPAPAPLPATAGHQRPGHRRAAGRRGRDRGRRRRRAGAAARRRQLRARLPGRHPKRGHAPHTAVPR
jgi:hypothetical protein